MSLTREDRAKLPESDFAVPGRRKLPMHDKIHAGLAWDMLTRTKELTPEERDAAKVRIRARAEELGVDTSKWQAEADSSVELHFDVSAMAIEMPEVEDHPNRAPFKGILTRVDEPSDEPPGGATGKRVMIPSGVAEAAIPSLLGMAIDCDPNGDFDKHDPRFKIGIITGAHVDGNALHIEGYFFANDFPELWDSIQSEKSLLGFSYEVKVRIHDMNAPIWEVDGCVFTGAALLYKSKAAYHTTSLAAQAEKDDAMTADELKALNESVAKIAASIGALADKQAATDAKIETLKAKGASLSGPIIDQVQPHVAACMAAADNMDGAGVGGHPSMGHAAAIRRVAGSMLQAAVAGHMPRIYRDHDSMEASVEKTEGKTEVKSDLAVEAALAASKAETEALKVALAAATDKIAGFDTQLADLKAAKAKETAEPPRKTISAAGIEMLNKFSIKPDGDTPLTTQNVDVALKAAGVTDVGARLAAKLRLMSEGAIA